VAVTLFPLQLAILHARTFQGNMRQALSNLIACPVFSNKVNSGHSDRMFKAGGSERKSAANRKKLIYSKAKLSGTSLGPNPITSIIVDLLWTCCGRCG